MPWVSVPSRRRGDPSVGSRAHPATRTGAGAVPRCASTDRLPALWGPVSRGAQVASWPSIGSRRRWPGKGRATAMVVGPEASVSDQVPVGREPVESGAASGKAIEGRSLGRIAWTRLKRDKVAIAGGVVVVLLILIAILAPLIVRYL